MLTDHFTATEWARYAQGGAAVGMRRLRRYLGGRYKGKWSLASIVESTLVEPYLLPMYE